MNCWDTLRAMRATTQLETVNVKAENRVDWAISRKASKDVHGTHRAYAKGCRCNVCREAERLYRNDVRSKKDFTVVDFQHGKRRGYRAGCRCKLCSDASRRYEKQLDANWDLTAADFPHGTVTGMGRGCRCIACVDVKRKTERDRKRERHANDHEYRERLRAQGRLSMSTPRAKKLHVASVSKRNALIRASVDDLELVKRIYLATPEGYTVDHILPLARGGSHTPDNLQYLPPSINCAKHARLDYDASKHALRWQDILDESSTTIA